MGSQLAKCMEGIEAKEVEYDMLKDKVDLGIISTEAYNNKHTIKKNL